MNDKRWLCVPQPKHGAPMAPEMRGCGNVWTDKTKPTICPSCLNPSTRITRTRRKEARPSRVVFCHGCGIEIEAAKARWHTGEPYCIPCDDAPAEEEVSA